MQSNCLQKINYKGTLILLIFVGSEWILDHPNRCVGLERATLDYRRLTKLSKNSNTDPVFRVIRITEKASDLLEVLTIRTASILLFQSIFKG